LPKFVLRRIIPDIPIEFLYGLRHIELRAREGAAIGDPFGYYRFADKVLVLYSLPLQWSLTQISEPLERSVTRFFGDISKSDELVTVSWSEPFLMGFWFFDYVFCHELGHHFDEQYHHRRGRTEGRPYEEAFADLQGLRISKEWWKRRRRKISL
jgi:hypothetical protein